MGIKPFPMNLPGPDNPPFNLAFDINLEIDYQVFLRLCSSSRELREEGGGGRTSKRNVFY